MYSSLLISLFSLGVMIGFSIGVIVICHFVDNREKRKTKYKESIPDPINFAMR